jgi:hypothetical protein
MTMSKKYEKYVFVFFIFLVACSPEGEQLDNMDFWKQEWQMAENVLDKKYELANEQFDKLLKVGGVMNKKTFVHGLIAKIELNRTDQVDKLLSDKPLLYKRLLCEKAAQVSLFNCNMIPLESVKFEDLRDTLITMYVVDQYVRGNHMTHMINSYNLDSLNINRAIYEDSDQVNIEKLIQIIENYGFPTLEMVGFDAMNGLFYIIQHSQDLSFQEQMLPNIKLATENKSLSPDAFAYLYDRLQIRKDKKQLYGTQVKSLDMDNNEVIFFPIEDSLNIDQRRLKFGMEPFFLYRKIIQKSFEN